MATGALSESEKKMVDTVLGLVLYAVGVGLLAWGFLTWLYSALPSLNTYGADVVIGALILGISVAVFKVRI
jgi:uncharacterized BrkB/YihY/UPF0761 family membrane protein